MWKKTILILMMAGVMMMSLSNANLYEEILGFFEPVISFFSDKEPTLEIIRYSETPADTIKDYGSKIVSRQNDIVVISDKEFKVDWFPDSSPLSDYRNLTVIFQVENLKTGKNYSLKGNGLIPKNFTGEFDINLSSNNFLTIPHNFSWESSTTFTTGISNYTTEANNKTETMLIEEKSYSDYKKETPLKTEIEGGFLDPSVSACGSLSSPGVYTLTQSISGTGICISISSENVTLDCANFVITYKTAGGTGMSGINNSGGYDNASVSNCTIQAGSGTGNTGKGIAFTNVINSKIFNNKILTGGGNSNYGIQLTASSNNNISNNVISTNGTSDNYGILLISSSINNTVFNNNIRTNGSAGANYGIEILTSSTFNIFERNTITTKGTSADYGFYINANNQTMLNNTISTSGSGGTNYAFYIEATDVAASYNTINTSGGTTSYAFFMVDGTKHNLTSNNLGSVAGDDLNFVLAGMNGTSLNDQQIRKFTFAGKGSRINIRNTTTGIIDFFNSLNGTGNNLYGNSTSSIIIGNNSVTVDNANFNVSANITLLNLNEFRFAAPAIMRDGIICNRTTPEPCINFTSLNASVVTFNVTRWSNYSIGETADIFGPAFSNNQTNTTSPTNGSVVQLNLTIKDPAGVSSYKLMVNDTLDGSFVNQSLNFVSGNVTAVFNYTIVNFTTAEGGFGWKVWANDTLGFSAESVVYTFKVNAPTDTCTCPSPAAAWNVILSDQCKITTACDIRPYNLSLTGTGNFSIFAQLYARNIFFQPDNSASSMYLSGAGELIPNKDG